MAKKNDGLGQAKEAKKDEFYTQYEDIQREMNAYLEYDENVFKDKTVLLPCDDPEWSNFTKFFAQNFERYGLKKVISTSYAPESKQIKSWQPTFFETESPYYDADKSKTNGKIFILDHDTKKNGVIDIDDLEWKYLDGDGDFRSPEVKALRDEADIIITNPPFSLFREFMAWIMEANKKCIVIGNVNAVTYKEIFPLIKENRLWPGTRFNKRVNGKNMTFRVPDDYEMKGTELYEEDGKKYISVAGTCWFTNIDHGRRHQPIPLMTMEDNILYSKHKEIKGVGYKHYDNYDAIEVPYSDAIPSDYDGVMGVPITFLDKFCPEQFEILWITQRNDDPYKMKKYTTDEYPNANDLNARAVIITDGVPKTMYARLLIKKLNK